jgi:predicted DNA-binding transcriptional regulator AlpA
MSIQEQLKIKGITIVELAEKMGVTRKTIYKKFEDGKWKTLEKQVLTKLGITLEN